MDWSMAENEKEGTLYFAGACRPNPGHAGIAYVLYDSHGYVVDEFNSLIDPYPLSSNAAHYRALIDGLRSASNFGFTHIVACGHLELISNQFNGRCACRKPNMQRYQRKVRKIGSFFEDLQIQHVSEDENSYTRSLVQECFM
ncbi:hypothetical protein SUGI_0521910 [Cryptomeria japonica]|uniref:uncharacterized protein LOC131063811 n=1 Tax=Cryptomeria japonica TaxID=3369 RepID=UPI002408A508|nr:uncharacterized protein LOC131063811 [Cryptomeria japonica]GLJ26770.1 hypothetical protein SUGI_0521910 [Cryptomeria japonica]